MRKILTITIFAMLTLPVFAQMNNKGIGTPTIDQRVELLSIVFRLAGSEEYNGNYNKLYVKAIHEHFDKFKDHELIKFAKEIRNNNSIGFDAVMFMAIYLNQPPSLQPIIPFNKELPDKRWNARIAQKFNQLLLQFYIDTDFKSFFASQKDKYDLAAKQFDEIFKQLDINWYYKYYGTAPKETFDVIIGYGNGGGNYGPKITIPGKGEIVYAIMGVWKIDSLGVPYLNKSSYLPTLIHEFNHSFVNHLTTQNLKALQGAGQTIYGALSKKMQDQAYGTWHVMMSEALVRASVIRYLQSHDPDPAVANAEMQEQLQRGFVWIKDLVELLGIYETNRQKYPTMESFMPEVIAFYNRIAPNIEQIKSNYIKTLPYVTSIEEFKNGDTAVDPNIKQIKIWFSEALSGKRFSINLGEKGEAAYPLAAKGKPQFTDNNKAVVLILDPLKPDFDYQFVLTGRGFKTSDDRPLQEYEVNFRTKK